MNKFQLSVYGSKNQLYQIEQVLIKNGFVEIVSESKLHDTQPMYINYFFDAISETGKFAYSNNCIGRPVDFGVAAFQISCLKELGLFNNKKQKTMNQIEVEVNGNKVTLTLTDDQIKQLQSSSKKEWWEEIGYKGKYAIISNWDGSVSCYDILHTYDSRIREINDRLCFSTKIQADIAAEYINLFIEMYNFAQLRNGGAKIAWGSGISKYVLRVYGIHNGSIASHVERFTTDCIGAFNIAFIKEEHAKEALKIFGKRIEQLFSKLQNY